MKASTHCMKLNKAGASTPQTTDFNVKGKLHVYSLKGQFPPPCKIWDTLKNYGLFTLPDTDSATDSDSDYKPDGNIVLCRTCPRCTDSDLDPEPDWDPQSLLNPFLGRITVPRLGSKSVSCNVNKPRVAFDV